ncbi:MAG: nodulation protein NfeD [Terriglobales bacterium]
MKAPFKAVVLLVAALLLAPALARADVLKIEVRDTIHPISDEFIGRALEQAARDHDEAVIIELSTPGGLLDSTRSIIQKILASPVPVIVYVAPSSARAASAGFFILESADVAAMAPGTNTGAAHPVVFGGEKMDDVMKAKMENDAAAFMRSFVSKRGRNVELAESAVRQSKSFTDQEALKEHLIDVIAADVPDLLKQLDGRKVTRFDGSTTVLHLANQRVQSLEMSLKQRILDFIMDPNVAFVLFAIGMLALYVEFNHPGAIVPGVVGFIFVLLAIFAFNILPTRHAALIMIVAAFVMFILDAKFATHGALTVGGIALMILGALLLVDAPIPEMRVRLVTALAVSVPIGLITVFLVGLVIKARRSKVVTGSQGLIGEIGVAQSALQPEGKVFVHGELWDAVSSTNVAPGARVLVKRIDGLRLSVEPVK